MSESLFDMMSIITVELVKKFKKFKKFKVGNNIVEVDDVSVKNSIVINILEGKFST